MAQIEHCNVDRSRAVESGRGTVLLYALCSSRIILA
jgi:hypothetical protein